MAQLMTESHPADGALALRVGDLVEVRSASEILATLDEQGELDNLPFMPEMVAFCGQRMTVHKVAHKVCDTVSRTGMRRLGNAVFLTGARCDGSSHGGCQTGCATIWREQWLKRVEPDHHSPSPDVGHGERMLLPLLVNNTKKEPDEDGQERYSCQATEVNRAATTCLPLRNVGQFVMDVRTGNASVLWTLRTFFVGIFNRLQKLSVRVLPKPLRFRRGLRWRFLEGRAGARTPTGTLGLVPGELVRIKPREEILATLNKDLLNRGMGFDEEMSRFCGRVARVQARVDRCIDESSGRMLSMKNPCIILENTVCEGAYNLACPREMLPFWREIWLERVESEDA